MSTSSDEPIGVGEFRQRATELIRAVEEEGVTVTIARRGHPVAELRPVTRDAVALEGSVTVADGLDLTEPVVDPGVWSAG